MKLKLSTKIVFTSIITALLLAGCNSNNQSTQDMMQLSM